MLKYFKKINERKEKVIERSYNEYCQKPLTQKDIDEFNSTIKHAEDQYSSAFKLGMILSTLSTILIFPTISLLSPPELDPFYKFWTTTLCGFVVLFFSVQFFTKKTKRSDNRVRLKIDDHKYIESGNLSPYHLKNSHINSENIDPNHSVHKLINAIKALDRPILYFERHLILEKLKV